MCWCSLAIASLQQVADLESMTLTILGKFENTDTEGNNFSAEIRTEGNYRSLYFTENQLQSRMSLETPYKLVLAYTRFMTFPLLMQNPLRKILIVGIGSGSFIRFFHHHFPECHIDAVDCSADVIKMSRGYFLLPDHENISMNCTDGFAYLKDRKKAGYDLILIDAFDQHGMAPTIYSDTFFRLCSENLRDSGCVSSNLWSNDQDKLELIKASLSTHFRGSIYLPVPDRGNIVALSFKEEVDWKKILVKPKLLRVLAKNYDINFSKMLKIAKQQNLSLKSRISTLLH